MAYDRAPRLSLLGRNQTGPNVAPNSYQTSYDELCSCKGSNWAPFLVCSGRKTESVFITPAPNAYYPKINKKIPGGASMLYTEERFPGNKFAVPIPQEYDPYHDGEYLDDTDKAPPRPKGFLYHCNTPYTIKGYCPSIPNKWHKGYDTLFDGTLIECCNPETDATLGPDFYSVSYHTFGTCYRGSYWSRYSGRKVNVTSDTPGVGTYDIQEKPNEMQEFLKKLRGEREKNSCVLRYMAKLQNDAIRNNFPAPNQYTAHKPKLCQGKKKILVPKKLVKIRKLQRKSCTSPGPNEYNDPRTALWYLKKPSCVKELNAFLTNEPRFRKSKKNVMPAPNNYTIKSFVDEMNAKVSPYAVREKVAFNTSVPKKLYYLPPDYLPIIKKKPCKCSSYPAEPESPTPPPHPTYPFASKTERFKTFEVNYTASPASYNITEPFKSITQRKCFRKVKKYNFLVGEKRFARTTNFKVEEDKSYIPFINYNLDTNPHGMMCGCFISRPTFDRQIRFPEKESDIPGPLDYNVPREPKIRTFNVTLNPPFLTPYQSYKMKTRLRVFDPDQVEPKGEKPSGKVCYHFTPNVLLQPSFNQEKSIRNDPSNNEIGEKNLKIDD